jgi:parallel beta-helix repeat protein
VKAAKTIYVPNNYTTIQEAIDNATAGDTIYVWAGTYNENVIVNKTVTLIGNGSANTTIDGGGTNNVVTITTDWVNLTGFKVTNSGTSTLIYPEAGIWLDNVVNVTISNNNCSNNHNGINIMGESKSNIIKNNLCFNNLKVGILICESDLNKIDNNTCNWNGYYGIRVYYGDSNKISNNSCFYNDIYGIYIRYSNLNILNKNICNFNNYGGILNSNSISNTIDNSICKFNNYPGIIFNSSESNILTNNICNLNYNSGIYLLSSESNIFANNTCDSNDFHGIYIKESDFNVFTNNTCHSNKNFGIKLKEAISNIFMSNRISSIIITGNKLEHWNTHTIDTLNTIYGKPVVYWKNRIGGIIPPDPGQIILANCSNVNIEYQNINDTKYPIMLGFSNRNLISNNSVANSLNGIYLFYSDSNLISNNTCNFNLNNGIELLHSKNNTIVKNRISENGDHGIYFTFSHGNTITENNFFSNDKFGIRINNSNRNNIYFNNFINNTVQALVDGESNNNQWDNGNEEGNYWSDYIGLDNGGNDRIVSDGIGDTEIPHLNLDNYPFVNLSGWLFPGIPRLIDPGDFDSDGSYIISWYSNRGTTTYILEEDIISEFNNPKTVYYGADIELYITNRTNGTYYYRLKAFSDHYESPWSNIVDITVDWPPDKPQNLTVSVYPEGNALNISWEINAIDVDIYELYYKSEQMTAWKFLTSLHYPEHSFDHINLIDGEKYEYKLQAWDVRDQSSEFSDIVSGIPQDSIGPKPPTGLEITDITFYSINLSWEPNTEEDVVGYNIYRYNVSNLSGWGDLIGIVLVGNESFLDKTSLQELTTYYYVVTAFDEVPIESNFSAMAVGTTKMGPHGPEINNSVADFEIDEDGLDDSTINLYSWFKDINNDGLFFWCESSDLINVRIFQDNGTVILRPAKDWYGNETLVFYASDGILNISAIVNITIKPVNDPPNLPEIIEPISGIEIFYGTLLNFKGKCSDPDLPADLLTINWSSNIQGELGKEERLVGIELIPGEHRITMEVNDKAGENSSATITVIVIKSLSPQKQDDKISYLIISIISGSIILIVLLLLFFVIHKKHKVKKERPATIEPTTSRFSLLSLRVSETTPGKSGKKSIQSSEQKKQIPLSLQTQQKNASRLINNNKPSNQENIKRRTK